ncbi:hypothetical protein LTS18_010442, partial [Coniosporium uncinatum]
PDDSTQTIYVWLDALVNYITKAGYPWDPSQAHAGGWPADCQVIGKDIVRFHCIYWPAFLIALGLPPPSRILTHAHWTLGHSKMAKSTGNVVNPFFALDRFGVDTMRFYLAYDGGIENDSDYSNYHIINRYNNVLKDSLGGLTSRVLRGKGWSVRGSVERVREQLLEQPPEDELHRTHHGIVKALAKNMSQEMDKLDSREALFHITGAIAQTNRFMHAAEPWKHVKPPDRTTTNNSDAAKEVDPTIFLCAETLRIAGILLQAYMPGKAAHLLDMLGVDQSMRTFEHAQLGADADYGVSKVELGKRWMGALFPPLTSDE